MSFSRRARVLGSSLELAEAIYPTPLVRLPKLSMSEPCINLWAKLEFYNPFSRSIKDRAAISMLTNAIRRTGASRFYEATSGNLGVALAALAAAHGVRFRAYVPRTASASAVNLMRLMGAEVVVHRSEGVDDELVETARRDADADGAVFLDQYHNEDNPRGQEALVAELRDQLAEAGVEPVAVVAGTGSLGHMTALGRLRDEMGFALVAARPAEGERIPGLRRDWKRRMIADEVIEVTLEESIEAAVAVARMEGLPIGVSSGATVAAARKASRTIGQGDYVMIFPDDAVKYLDIYGRYIAEHESAPQLVGK
ncbi:PLP-dependent cysteine synthase family protein [Conexivisphaera calida]|uniref:Cysteine synthase n=1 Tax=Conexivisphaera calida TaxID=1874277 RepID=A0A4V0P1R3_9ARCH|nr:pyridoxal-phosphate dependent enzyme [Conexivisphaera calida]BBE42620.1 Cysteine synthase [Conexivisphaera calida]